MKKLIFALCFASLIQAANAAGQFDGVYVNLASSGSYLSIHTNNNKVIATAYGIIPASGIKVSSLIGDVSVRQLNTWDLYQGTISGSVASLSGQVFYNACNVSVTLNLTESGGTVFVTSASNTLVGNSSGVNCSAFLNLVPNGISFQKVF